MPRPLSLRRRALPGVAAIVCAVAVTACNGITPVGAPPAAIVGGHHISASRVFALLKAQEANLKIEQAKNPADKTTLAGDGSEAWKTSSFADTLGLLIQLDLLQTAVQQHGGHVTAAERSSARSTLISELATAGSTSTSTQPTAAQLAAGKAALAGRPKPLVDFSIEYSATRTELIRVMAKGKGTAAARTEQLEAAYRADKAQFAEVCVKAIVTTTEAQAKAADAEVKAGADFVAVARKVSIDSTTSDGTPTCFSLAQAAQLFGASVASAEVGAVFGPVAGNGAYVLAQVASFKTAPFSAVRSQLESSLPPAGTNEADAVLQKLLQHTHITVDPRFGSWDAATGVVKPPEGAATTTTTSTPATTPAG